MKTKKLLLALFSLAAVVFYGCSGSDDTETAEYTVTVTDNGNGSGKASPSKAAEGTTVTLTATADEGYEFMQWIVEAGGATLSDATDNPATFTMPAENVKVKAEFIAEGAEKYIVTVSEIGNGTAKAEPAEAYEGTLVTLSATADEGHDFIKWVVVNGDITLSDAAGNPATFTMPAGDVEVRAEFTDGLTEMYLVMVYDDGNGTGEADPAEAVEGETVTITATASKKYEFDKWVIVSGNPEMTGEMDSNPTTFIMPAENVVMRAEFKLIVPDDILTTITDPNFLAYAKHRMTNTQSWSNGGVTKTFAVWDMDDDGKLSPAEAADVEFIGISRGYPADGAHKIASLDGIEHFTGLKILLYDHNELPEHTPAINPALTFLDCSGNNVTYLDVSENTDLTHLSCGFNNLASLDVSKNTALTFLNCSSSGLSTFNVGNQSAITYLVCTDNYFTSLDFLDCPNLDRLNCSLNQLASLDLSKWPKLWNLDCRGNRLTSLSLPENSELYDIMFENNRIAEFDASNMKVDNGNYHLQCGQQRTADDKAPQEILLTLSEAQKPLWDTVLKEEIGNKGVLIAGIISEITSSSGIVIPGSGVMINPYIGAPGTIVYINAVPGNGYKFNKWTVISGNIIFKDSTSQNTSFVMPLTDGVISAEFVAK